MQQYRNAVKGYRYAHKLWNMECNYDREKSCNLRENSMKTAAENTMFVRFPPNAWDIWKASLYILVRDNSVQLTENVHRNYEKNYINQTLDS